MEREWSDGDLQHHVAEGQWVADNLNASPATTVGSLVPAGFGAYVRILYPVPVSDPHAGARLVRWSDIAHRTGAVAHAEMELHTIRAKVSPAFLRSNPPIPATPTLPWSEQLALIVRVLAKHTSTPDDCWFAIWEGNTALDDIRAATPTVTINGDNYFLLRGPGARAIQSFRGLSPHIWWPADHSWCMVAHFDFPSVYLGGSQHTVDDILSVPEIEAWPARVDQKDDADNDHLNNWIQGGMDR